LQEGNRYAREKQYDKAVDAYRQAIELNSNLAAAYHGLGTTYFNMGRVGDSLEPLRTTVRLDPNNSVAHLNLGITLASLRLADEALKELNEAKRLSPNDARIHNEIGNVLHNSFGRIDDALAEYIESRRLNPNVPAIHHNIGLMLMRLGRFSEAIAPFEEALRLSPDYRNARYFLSDAYTKTGSYDKAIESWNKFLELVPNGPDALTNRSWDYLYEGGHGREAAADARKFLDVHGWRQPTSAYLAIMANLGYRGAGMNDEAQAILEEATNKIKSPNWPFDIIRYLKEEISGEELLRLATDNDKRTEVHAYMGMDLLLRGKRDEAQTQFEWVKQYGNKRFFEYPLAVEELKRLR
jgi:tetratricopeptide (TPR) repeat protein